jgi:ribosomal protein S18 acetylase RimI-like enzyme
MAGYLPGSADFAHTFDMEKLALTVRKARPDDAAEIARVYITSWHDTYPGMLPMALLCAMTPRGQTARWRSAIRARGLESVLVAEHEKLGIVAMASCGPSRDKGLGRDGEIYTLYVDPAYFGMGAGKALMNAAFDELRSNGFSSCVIWAHARNPARFFYETLGGKIIAERTARMMGEDVPEIALGWTTLAPVERSAAR